MRSDFDVIVIGAGSFGLSTGYNLAKEGAKVLLIDAGDPPHSEGSHHGSTRIVRAAYTMGAAYVQLALRAQQLWKELEQLTADLRADGELQVPLYEPIGVVSIGPVGSSFIHSKAESCRAFQIPHERLTAEQLVSRWPGLSVPDHMEGLFEPEAGVLYSERIVRTYRKLAELHGAELLTHTKVEHVSESPAGHVVHTTAGNFTASRVLVSAGAWSGGLLPELADVVTAIRKPIAWFEAPTEQYGRGALPAFIINNGGEEEYFGFPDLDGSGLKIGRHDGGQPLALGDKAAEFGSYAEDEGELRGALEKFLPGVGSLLQGQICLYERSPGERFLLGELPQRSGVWFAGGGSGHGFKFTSAIGEALGAALLDQQQRVTVAWDQFSLRGVLGYDSKEQ